MTYIYPEELDDLEGLDDEEVTCAVCYWHGLESELEYDLTEDEYHCPKCGKIFVDM